jgi:Ca2+-binding EF-hand superfamily protein
MLRVINVFADLKELFEAKDEDHTGYINKDELAECLFAVGFCPTNADVEFLHSHFDVNGKHSFKAFVSLYPYQTKSAILNLCHINLPYR